MDYKVFKLNEHYPKLTDVAVVKQYVHEKNREFGENRVYPAMIVFPGGGYGFCSEREAEPIAMKFYAEGYNVFTLYYTVTGGDRSRKAFPDALLEGCALIDYVRNNAEELLVDPNKIAVIGFSAGGHLAGTVCTRGGDKLVTDFLGREAIPNAGVLCYPVITGGKFAHRGSFINYLGTEDLAEHEKNGVENFVSEKTPPIFMFHSADDPTVPIQNSLMMGMKLAEYKIPFEYHVYKKAGHGISTATKMVNTPSDHVANWISDALYFLKEIGVSL